MVSQQSVTGLRTHGTVPPWVAEQFIFKYGFNPNAAAGEAIWGVSAPVVWPTAQAQASIVSDDAGDTTVGAGAQTLSVQGVDDNFDFVSESGIALNGLGAVNTLKNYLFIDRAFVETHGADASETNLGNITITIGGVTTGLISAGDGQTLQAVYIVPNALEPRTRPYLTQVFATIGRQAATFARLRLIIQSQVGGIGAGARRSSDDLNVHSQGTSFVNLPHLIPASLTAGDRIWWNILEVSSMNTGISGGFEIGWW